MPAADHWIRFAERAERRASVERRRANRWIGVAGALAALLVLAVFAAVAPRAIGSPTAAQAVRHREERSYDVRPIDLHVRCDARGTCRGTVCALWVAAREDGRWVGQAYLGRFRDRVVRRGGRWVVYPGSGWVTATRCRTHSPPDL